MFELEDAGTTHNEVETRYPFLDLRIVNYLLAIPPFPWCFQKMLLREAMAGRLPERVRGRPKTPLHGDPVLAQLRRTGAKLVKQMHVSPELDRYIERSALAEGHDKMNIEQIRGSFRPHCLNIWLQSAGGVGRKMYAETGNGSTR